MFVNKLIAPLVLIVALGSASLVGCVSTGGGNGIQAIEQMSDLDFNKWKLYLQLGVKIGANRLIDEGAVSAEEVELTATVLETLRDQSVVPGGKSFIKDALEKSGLTNDEIELLLVIVEQELISRGALDWLDPTTGLVAWSPRTKDILTIVAQALRSTAVVTVEEVEEAQRLEAQYNGKLL